MRSVPVKEVRQSYLETAQDSELVLRPGSSDLSLTCCPNFYSTNLLISDGGRTRAMLLDQFSTGGLEVDAMPTGLPIMLSQTSFVLFICD